MIAKPPGILSPSSAKVCAVVISFFPDAAFQERLERIAEQVSRVIVVDNGTEGESAIHLKRALDFRKGLTLIRNGANLGVAAALNQGIGRVLSETTDCSWIATFDQDSLPAADMVTEMLAVWKDYPHPEKLMAAGPRTVFVGGARTPEPAAGRSWREVSHVITSGSLISRRAFELAGPFNEGLFIDYVDIEYCLRLRSMGYRIIEVLSTEILHHMGRLEERLFLGEKVHPTHHPPQRRYYQVRNALLLHRQYGESQPLWRRRNRIVLTKILILILLYEKQRLRSLMQIFRGIGHGLAGRAGRDGEMRYVPGPVKTA